MNERKRASRTTWIAGSLVGMLVAYPLSLGPVVWTLKTLFPNSSEPMWVDWVWLYYVVPLDWASKRLPQPVQALFGAYVNWWSELAGP